MFVHAYRMTGGSFFFSAAPILATILFSVSGVSLNVITAGAPSP
jgi:hypothetical protein